MSARRSRWNAIGDPSTFHTHTRSARCFAPGFAMFRRAGTINRSGTGLGEGDQNMRWEQKVEYATLSDVGFRRQNNQDCATVLMAKGEEEWQERGHLFVVCDGMGGHAVGELASKIAVDT